MSEVASIFAVFLLRSGQTIAHSMPTLLMGMACSGFLRAFVGGDRVRRFLGRCDFRSVFAATILGMLLPVCEIGAVPVLFTLRRMGASLGCCVALAVAAPLFTPWTLGYLMDACHPPWAFALIALNAVMAIAAGLMAGDKPINAAFETDVRPTLLELLRAAGQSLSARVLAVICTVAIGSGLLAICVPANWIGDALVERSMIHAGLIAATGLVAYVPPALLAMQAGILLRETTMPGLAPWLICLAGINLGAIVIGLRALGAIKLLKSLVVIGALGCLAAVPLELGSAGRSYTPEDSHAFEDLGRPYHLLNHPDGPVAGFVTRFARPLGWDGPAALLGIAMLVLASRFIGSLSTGDGRPWTGRSLALLGSGYVLGVGFLGAYLYYPPPGVLAAELRSASADLSSSLRTGDAAIARITTDRMARRLHQLPTSMWLRGRSLSDESRDTLESLKRDLPSLDAGDLTFRRRLAMVLKEAD